MIISEKEIDELLSLPEDIFKARMRNYTDKIVYELKQIMDIKIRSLRLAQNFSQLPALFLAEMLHIICEEVIQKNPLYEKIFLGLVNNFKQLTQIIGDSKIKELLQILRKKKYTEVIQVLVNAPPSKRKMIEELEADLGTKPLDVSLGQKKSLAKKQDKIAWERLIYDQNTSVITNLLNNPRMTEQDILKIASKRPTSCEILEAIAENKKWVSRYPVKKALIYNPYTPTRISISLMNFLLIQDLEELCQHEALHEEIRKPALDLLKKRKDASNSFARFSQHQK